MLPAPGTVTIVGSQHYSFAERVARLDLCQRLCEKPRVVAEGEVSGGTTATQTALRFVEGRPICRYFGIGAVEF